MKQIYSYIEDELGGYIVLEEDTEYFLKKEKEMNPVVCCKGTKKEVEEYIGSGIDNYIRKKVKSKCQH